MSTYQVNSNKPQDLLHQDKHGMLTDIHGMLTNIECLSISVPKTDNIRIKNTET